jgi:hypothetical protein
MRTATSEVDTSDRKKTGIPSGQRPIDYYSKGPCEDKLLVSPSVHVNWVFSNLESDRTLACHCVLSIKLFSQTDWLKKVGQKEDY